MGICIEITGRKPRVRPLAIFACCSRPNSDGTVEGGRSREVVLFDRSVRSDRKLPFHFQKFSLPVPLQLVSTVKMVDCSDVSVYDCGVCKLQKRDINFLLMHSSTQGSVTAVHINLLFLSGFRQSLKTNMHYWFLQMLTMFSRVFLSAVSDPSPYGFDTQCEKNPQLIPTTSTSSTKTLER